MFRKGLVGPLLGVMWWTSSARAQEQSAPTIEITYVRALNLARQHAPALKVAQGRIHEAQTQARAAGIWRFNPQLMSMAGPRFGTAQTVLDGSVGLIQWLETGGQLQDRMRAAQAGLRASKARAQNDLRLLLRDVGRAYASSLFWKRRMALAQENLRLALDIQRVARQRHEAGDVGGLEATVSDLSVARAQASKDQAQVALVRGQGQLKRLLGLDVRAHLVLVDDLHQLSDLKRNRPARTVARSDLRALRQNIEVAKARSALGRSQRAPNVRLGISYTKEERDDLIRGSLAVALPIFDHGQGEVAIAKAQRDRARAELDVAERSVLIETKTASVAAAHLREAVRRFEAGGLSVLKRAELLGTASYAAGAIPLGELLAIRRELIQAKLDYIELMLQAGLAQIELSASTGAFP